MTYNDSKKIFATAEIGPKPWIFVWKAESM